MRLGELLDPEKLVTAILECFIIKLLCEIFDLKAGYVLMKIALTSDVTKDIGNHFDDNYNYSIDNVHLH